MEKVGLKLCLDNGEALTDEKEKVESTVEKDMVVVEKPILISETVEECGGTDAEICSVSAEIYLSKVDNIDPKIGAPSNLEKFGIKVKEFIKQQQSDPAIREIVQRIGSGTQN